MSEEEAAAIWAKAIMAEVDAAVTLIGTLSDLPLPVTEQEKKWFDEGVGAGSTAILELLFSRNLFDYQAISQDVARVIREAEQP